MAGRGEKDIPAPTPLLFCNISFLLCVALLWDTAQFSFGKFFSKYVNLIKFPLGNKDTQWFVTLLCVLSHIIVSFSHVLLFVTPWTEAHEDPLSMEFCRQEYWRGLPFPPPGYLPDPGIKPAFPGSPALQADSLPAESLGKPLFVWLEFI